MHVAATGVKSSGVFCFVFFFYHSDPIIFVGKDSQTPARAIN